MEKQDRGAVLTSVILMVLVMTLIGVPLLGVVVFNYQLREMDNSLRRSEYETEIVMDQIYLVIRETVINAIEYAKTKATESVDAASKSQINQYTDIKSTYEGLWDAAMDNYGVKDANYSSKIATIFQNEVSALKLDGMLDETKDEIEAAATIEAGKTIYVNDRVKVALNYVSEDSELMGILENAENAGVLINAESGTIDDSALRNAYNLVFEHHYHDFLKNTLINADGTTNELSNIDVQIEKSKEDYKSALGIELADWLVNEGDSTKDSYLVIKSNVVDSTNLINVNVSINFRKSANVFPAGVSATFVIGTPELDSVTSVEQYTIPLSNPMTSRGVTVGGTLNVNEGTTFNTASDITIMTYNEYTDEDVEDGIVLTGGSTFTADSGVAVNGDIRMSEGGNFTSGSKELYYRNLYVGKLDEKDVNYGIHFGGNVVAKDDLEIETEGSVTITQNPNSNYYGYNDMNDEGPDSSSSIVVNSKSLTGKTLQFGNLYLAGRAFIDGAIKAEKDYVADEEGLYILNGDEYVIATPENSIGKQRYSIKDGGIYKTGESIAVKGNYIAYQTPLTGDYAPDKVKFSRYFISNSSGSSEKDHSLIYLADEFIESVDDFNMKKHEYFTTYATNNAVKKLNVTVNNNGFKHLEGTGFSGTNVKERVEALDKSYIVNWGNNYEKYTKYFGYSASDDAKTRIFGANGWISENTNFSVPGDYKLIYDMSTAKTELPLTGETEGIIIVKGDLEITVTGSAEFSGMLIVGGNLTVKGGGTLTLTDAKDSVVNMIIGSYLGDSNMAGEMPGDAVGEVAGAIGDQLYDIFEYDDSGTTYVVTKVNMDSFVNANELINITNWTKQDTGRL